VGSKQLHILVAGGGTGGHLFPAIAVADEIRVMEPDAQITFIGTRGKIEARVVPERGYPFVSIWISGFKRTVSFENVLFPLKVIVATMQSFFLIRRLKPDVVVGTGGYVCGPVVYVASLLGIPTLIHEQNSYPGITTRVLAGRVREVHISFEGTRRYLRRADNVKLSGNPTRAAIGTIGRSEGASAFELDPEKKTLLVVGGSLGAASINRAVLRSLPDLLEARIQLIWQTGDADFESINTEVERLGGASQKRGCAVRVYAFIDRMEYAYGACDLALCRSGAMTVAELTRAGVPSVLVPYPYAAAGHQAENARAIVEAGAAALINDNELNGTLLATVTGLFREPHQLTRMGERARSLAVPDASRTMARTVIQLAQH